MKKIRLTKGRKGSTLIELCVVIALVAVIATVTVSFSVLVGKYVGESRATYSFYEQASRLKIALADMLASCDSEGVTWSVTETEISNNENMSASCDGCFKLVLGGKEQQFGAVTGATFECQGQLLKCTIWDEENEQSFVIALRCAVLSKGE